MVADTSDTIAAVASAPGGALRGIVRMAGEQCAAVLEQVFVPDEGQLRLQDMTGPTRIPGAMDLGNPLGVVPTDVLVWPGQRSYTRQPAAEIHTIGSTPLLEAVLARLCEAGARIARPGEFTLRSFLAGRIDLTQAEAVLGVIDARDQRELQTALSQLAGGLATPLNRLRNELLELLAHLEAGLDFVEEDIEFISRDELNRRLVQAAAQIAALDQQMQRRRLASDRSRVVLRGEPNAGKSSLFNSLCGHPSAIVSPFPGTTRDYVSARVCCGSGEIDLVDTAGRESDVVDGSIAAAAQVAAESQSEQAALVVLCIDASRPPTPRERIELAACRASTACLVAWTKCDLAHGDMSAANGVLTSSHTGQGIAELKEAIVQRLAEQSADAAVVPGTAARCRESLAAAAQSLQRARPAGEALGEEFVAAEVRAALDHLGQIVGAVYTDDVLDRIFTRFCIGK